MADWKIEDLYRQAWSIVKNNKILWIFAAAAGAGSSFMTNINFNNKDVQKFQEAFNNFNPGTQPNNLSPVLGATAPIPFTYFFTEVPIWLYILLFVEIIILVLIGLFISVYYNIWAQAGLLENIHAIISGNKADMRSSSQKALHFIKPLLYINVVPGFLLTISALIVFVVLGIGTAMAQGGIKIILGILLFAAIIFSIYAFIMLGFTLIWATRKIITENTTGKIALIYGYKIARRKFWSTILLGIVNNILAFLVFMIPSAILAFIFSGGIAAGYKINELIIPLIILGGLLIIPLLVLITVGYAIIGAFKTTIWSLAYDKIKTQYEQY